MKDKILTLIIGILIGAIIATGCFFIYSKNKEDSSSQNETTQNGSQMGQPPEMPSGNNANGGQMPQGNPPSKPGEDSDSNSSSNSNNPSFDKTSSEETTSTENTNS